MFLFTTPLVRMLAASWFGYVNGGKYLSTFFATRSGPCRYTRNAERPSDGCAEIILPVDRGGGEHCAAGVELVVPEELIEVAMHSVCAALCHKRYQAAGGVSVLGVESVRDHLEFGDAVRTGTLEIQ